MRWPAANFLSVSVDGSKLACVRRYDVVVVDLPARRILYRCRPIPHPQGIAFSPDGHLLSLNNAHGVTVFLEAETGITLGAVAENRREGCEPKFTGDGRLLVGNWDGDLMLCSQRGEVVGHEQNHGEIISRISHDASRHLWLIAHTRKPISPRNSPQFYLTLRMWPDWRKVRHTFEMQGWIASATLSPCGRFIAYLERWWDPVAGSKRWGNTLHVLRVADGEVVTVSKPIDAGGTGFELAWSMDSRHVGVVTKHGFAFFNLEDASRQALLPCRFPASLAFLPNEKSVVLGTWERSGLRELDAIMSGQARM